MQLQGINVAAGDKLAQFVTVKKAVQKIMGTNLFVPLACA
jgi:hypothetical protein